MKIDKNIRHTKEELLSYSTALFQTALRSHISSPEMTKRSLLFLYLFGWRYITRRQIYQLLSYDTLSEQSLRSAREFISSFVRSDMIKKYSADSDNKDNDVFSITLKGLDLGRDYYLSEIQRVFDTNNVFFAKHMSDLLLGERENIAEYVQMFESYTTERYSNKRRASFHRLSTMDSYISLLLHLQPTSISQFGTEVKFSRGEVASEDSSLIAATSDVRSDAMFHMGMLRSGRIAAATGTDTQLVCIEQDMSHQRTGIIQDKIDRYVNLIALPRNKRYGIPLTVVFTVVPSKRSGKPRSGTGVRPVDQGYVEDITRFSILYSKYIDKDINRIALEEFARGFADFCGDGPLFHKHIKFLNDHLNEYGPQLPVSKLLDRHKELSAQDNGIVALRKKQYALYRNRKSTIFSAAAQVPGIAQVARTGFSICSTSNYEPTALLSLFPELSRGRDLLSMVLSGTSATGMSAEFVPFHKYRCHNGVEITFRNAYRIGQEVYIMENISEDYCGRLRLNALLENEPAPHIHFLAVFPLEEYVTLTKELFTVANERQRDCMYGCAYRSTEGGDIRYINPIRISNLPS